MAAQAQIPAVLFVFADSPGHFLQATFELAKRVKALGAQPVFAVTTPFYEASKGIALSELGPVYYLSEFLKQPFDEALVDAVPFDYWHAHATFVRTRHHWGKHINDWGVYRKIVLFFRDVFDRHENLRLGWSEPPTNAVLFSAHAEAERRGLPFFGYCSARLSGHFLVALDPFCTRFLDNPSPPALDAVHTGGLDYANNVDLPLLEAAVKRGPRQLWRTLKSGAATSVETGNTLGLQVRAAVRSLSRPLYYRYLRATSDLFDAPPPAARDGLDLLFPLHVRPEASTSVCARFYESDLDTVRNIAFSLPHRARLYVKEHPGGAGRNRRTFYQELKALPGVHLLPAELPLSEHLLRFDALICLTGTAGFEALQLGIPVLLLGRTFYESYPGVTRIDAWAELGPSLAALRSGAEPQPTDEPMKRHLETCFPGNFNYLSPLSVTPDNVARLVRPIELALNDSVTDAAPDTSDAPTRDVDRAEVT